MKTDGYLSLGRLVGHVVGVDHTLSSQDILMEHSEVNQHLASMLAFGDVETIHREDTLYWRIVHDWQVDDLAVELIDLLISIRYAHPAIVQLELALSESEGMSLEPDEP